MTRAPQFGQTFLLMLSCALLFFGAPLVLGYLLAYTLMPQAPANGPTCDAVSKAQGPEGTEG